MHLLVGAERWADTSKLVIEEFVERLADQLVRHRCEGSENPFRFASAALWSMGFSARQIAAAFREFRDRGAWCDCALLDTSAAREAHGD